MNDELSALSPSNSQALQAYLQSALATLGPLTPLTYYQEPLPSAADEVLMEIVNVFTAWSKADRDTFQDAIPEGKRSIFAIFGHRLATLSVRQLKPEWLRLGLIGNAIANHDMRYGLNTGHGLDVALAVFYHCAKTLELEPERLFDEAAAFASDDTASHFRHFGRREGLTLKQFGWREIRKPEGVSYKFEW